MSWKINYIEAQSEVVICQTNASSGVVAAGWWGGPHTRPIDPNVQVFGWNDQNSMLQIWTKKGSSIITYRFHEATTTFTLVQAIPGNPPDADLTLWSGPASPPPPDFKLSITSDGSLQANPA